nr:phospholipase-like protein [Tanacetum cinerariifolium]
MDLSDIEVPRVFVTCRNMDDWTENCILLHFMLGQQLELTVSGLKFGVKNSTDYNKAKEPIPFRRRVFSSYLDGRPIRGNDVLLLIESDVFKRLDDNDAISLCYVGILQLVLLGVEDRRHVPNWILRLVNDRASWDNYPWGSYVWPTLYKHLRDANVKRWQPLYASEPANETDTKSYSIEGFAWAFKTWILESFRAATNDYYTRYRRHPRIVVWSSKHKFYRNMLKPMLHRMGYQQLKENNADMYEKLTRFMEDTRRVPEAHTTPIIADQHFGVSDMSEFQSYQGAPSTFNTLANNISYFNMPTPSNLPTPNQSNWLSPSNWQTPNQSYLGTSNSQPPISLQPGTSNWQNQMPSRCQDAGILDPVDKTKKKGKTTKLSPLNLGNNFAAKNVSVDDVTITSVHQTDNYFNYETVDPDKSEYPVDGSCSLKILLLCDNPNLLFISDTHAAIALAVQDEFPLSYHAAHVNVVNGNFSGYHVATLYLLQ